MKVIFADVQVQVTPSGTPLRVTWGRRSLRVLEVLDAWRAWSHWWEGQYPRDYFLVAAGGVTAELYREDRRVRLPGFEADDAGAEVWVLARIVD